jgi:hypothetical protein
MPGTTSTEASATVLFPPATESDRDPARASTVHLPAVEKQSQNELPNRPAEQAITAMLSGVIANHSASLTVTRL